MADYAIGVTAVDTPALQELACEIGISELGVCRAHAYTGTEAAIAERGALGLFADLKFTMARPESSCHPERALGGTARSVVSAALCYWQPERADGNPARGRIARYTRNDAYETLRGQLQQLARVLEQSGHRAEVLVDNNHHVDREAAARSGVGFYGKNTNLITRHHGSWVVLGTLLTDAALEPTEPMRPGCGSCTRCIDACPTGAIVDAGVLDVNLCMTYWTQSRHDIPLPIRTTLEDRVYGCDICQDVCPWNRGVEKRRAGLEPEDGFVDLRDWLTASDAELDERYSRFFVPRRQMRFLRRNALVALGNSADPRNAALLAPWLESGDQMLREHARWGLERLGGDIAEAALAQFRQAGG
jgi:epoxyqueuosine reductase